MDVIKKEFEDASDFLEWASFAPKVWKTKEASRSTGAKALEFTHTANYEDAYDLAKYGWLEGIEHMQDALDLINANIRLDTDNFQRYDVAGDYPNVPLAAAGEVFSMAVIDRESTRRKRIISLEIIGSYSTYVDAEDILEWGACVVACVDYLENQGHSVEVKLIDETTSRHTSIPAMLGYSLREDNRKAVRFSAGLKQAGESVDLASLAFWIAHPSSLRRIFFSAMERLDIEEYFADGYGVPNTFTKCPDDVVRLAIMSHGKLGKQGLGQVVYNDSLSKLRSNIGGIFADLTQKYDLDVNLDDLKEVEVDGLDLIVSLWLV